MFFSPAQWLTRRLGFALKFTLVAAVLLVPLGMLTSDRLAAGSESQDFTEAELQGLALATPGTELLGAVLEARTAAVEGEDIPIGEIEARLADVRAAAQDSELEGFGPRVDALESSIETAAGASAEGLARFDAWNTTAHETLEYVVEAADASNLVLDPELTSYYLMDASVLALPHLREEVSRLHDLLHLSELDATLDVEVLVAETRTRALDLAQRFDSDIAKVVEAGVAEGIERTDVVGSIESVLTEVDRTLAGAEVDEVAAPVLDALAADFGDYETATLAALQDALESRLATDRADARSTLIEVAVAVALAMYIVGGVVVAVRRSSRPVMASLAGLAEGRFSVPDVPASRDELGSMAASVSAAIQTLRGDFADIERSSRALSEAALHVGAVSTQLAQSAESTTSQATVVAAGAEEMQASIREIASNAAIAADVGGAAQRSTVQANEHMHDLDERSRQISQMVDVIGEIAAQTNLLALNATIEAARAGAAGRGFAVVADEVKQLAGQTADATETIVAMVTQIHDGTSAAGASLAEIGSVIERVSESQQSISAAVEQQAMTTEEIAVLVAGFLHSSTETQASAQRLGEVAGELTATGSQLRSLVDRYQFA